MTLPVYFSCRKIVSQCFTQKYYILKRCHRTPWLNDFRFAEEGGDILAPVALTFAGFLERYLSADSSRAMKVLAEVDLALQQLTAAYPWMRILDDLLSACRCNASVTRRADDEEEKCDLNEKDEKSVCTDVGVWSCRPDLGTR